MEVDLAMQVVVWVLGGDWAKALLRRGEKPNRRIGGSRRDRRLGSRVSGSHKVVSPRPPRGYLPIEMVYRSQARPVGMRRPGERRGGGAKALQTKMTTRLEMNRKRLSPEKRAPRRWRRRTSEG